MVTIAIVGVPAAGHADDAPAPDGATVAAATPTARNNNVLVSLAGFGGALAYERMLPGHVGARVSAVYLPPGIERYSLGGAGAGIAVATGTRGHMGVASLGWGVYRTYDVTMSDDLAATFGAAEVTIAWRWLTPSGFNVTAGGGLGYIHALGDTASCDIGEGRRCLALEQGVFLAPVIELGYAF